MIQSVGKNLETDLESEQMKNLISAYWDISKENVDFMPVTGDWKSPFVYLHQDELDAAKQALKDELAGTKQPAREDNAAEAADGSLND